jgi:hypothetical protein
MIIGIIYGLFMPCDGQRSKTGSSHLRFTSRNREFPSPMSSLSEMISCLFFILCFYFPLFPSRSSTRCASVLYSHSLRIIIIHIFFRFLINSVHKSVKNHHSEALAWRRNVKKKNVKQFFNNTTFGALISRECIHICVTSALGNAR